MSGNELLNMLKANNKLLKFLFKDQTMILRTKKKMKKWISNIMRSMQLVPSGNGQMMFVYQSKEMKT